MLKKYIYLDSTNRESGTDSGFRFKIGVENMKDYDHICLLTANIPKSYYLIEADENTFTLQEGVSTATITVPVGNYTRATLKTTIQALLNSESPNSWTYTVTTPVATGVDDGKYTYAVTGNSGTQPAFIFSTYVANSLGFHNSTTNTFSGSQLISVRVPSLQLEDNIRVHCSLVRNDGATGGDDILESIGAVNNPYYGNILWVCPSVEMFGKAITRPEQMVTFMLTDESNTQLDLNGVNWTATLLLYKEDDTLKTQMQLMRMLVGQNLIQNLKQ